jgi:TP901 family phage tail tape measure protein
VAVFLDVLPRLGLSEAETAFDRLKVMARQTGEEMGISLGEGASAGLEKLKDAAISAERVVSDANRKMATSAGELEVAQARATKTADEATAAALRLADAERTVAEAGVATAAQARELDALRSKATSTSIAATAASVKATDAAAKAAQAERDHGDASIVASNASSKFADAEKNKGAAVLGTASVLNGVGAASFLAFGAAVGVSADKAAAFEQGQTKIVASTGETASGLKQVSDGILQMAGAVGYSTGELQQAMYNVEKGGFDAAKGGLDVLKAAAQGANAEQADLAEVTKGLTISMNDFHFPTQNAADVMSKLVVATGASTATFQEFTGALHSVEPAAAAAGIKYEDLLAVIARGTKSGASADQVTENIRNAINALSGAQGPARNAMAQLGISADDVSQHLGQRGLAGTMQYLADTIKAKMDPNNLIPVGVFKQNAQELDNMTASLQAMSPAAAQLAQGYRNGTVTAKEFRAAVMGSTGDDTKRLQDFKQWSDDLNDFSKRYKNGQSTLETYNQALRDVTGTVAGQTIALQVTGENADKTNDLIAKLNSTTRETDGSVIGSKESLATLNGTLREAKAAAGAVATEMGQAFIPALKGGADGLKTIAEFLAQHKTLVNDAVIAVGLLGATWATVKVGLAAQSTWTAITTGIDAVIGKMAAMRAASATTATTIEADAAAEATAARGVSAAWLGVAGAIGAAVVAGKQLTDWSRQIPAIHDRFQNADGTMKNGIDKWIVDNDIPILNWLEPSDAKKSGSGTDDGKVAGDYNSLNYSPALAGAPAPSALTPTPGALPVATQTPGTPGVPDPGTPSDGDLGGSGSGGKKPKATKDDPIWIAPANPSDFKSDSDHGITGSSIIKSGPDFTPKGIGTFFSALLVDLAVGNPIGKTLADEKRGHSASNPLYVSQVDVDDAQKKLDQAIHSYGPDSTEAKTASQRLAATQSMVGTTGGYYDPLTGAVSPRNVTGGGPTSNPVPGAGAEGWRSTVAATVEKYGAAAGIPQSQFGNWTDAIVRQIQTESGGNAGADNPNDSNGRGGIQHVAGLLQYLPSTFANSAQKLTGITDMMNPTAQIAGALLAGRNAAGGPTDIGNGVGWGPSRQPVDVSLVRNDPAPATTPSPGTGGTDVGGGGSILGSLESEFYGGGGEGPVFKRSGGNRPGSGTNGGVGTIPGAGLFTDATKTATDPNYNLRPDGTRSGPAPAPRTSGLDPFAPGGALSAPGSVIGGNDFGGIGLPGRPGGAAATQIGPFPVPPRVSAAAPPAPNAAPGSDVGARSTPGVGNSVANNPRSWGTGKGATSSIASSIVAAAGPMAAMAPGSAQAAQLADRTIGYLGQLGGIAVEGVMQSLIPTGGGGGIGDPSHSVLGKLAGGIAGAHKSAPNSAGMTAPPLPAKDDSGKQQGGGDTNHIGTQQNGGITVQGDMHVTTPDAKSLPDDAMAQNQYPTHTR